MLKFEMAHPQTDSAQPPEHDSHDCRHDKIRFGGEGGDVPDDELGNDEEPNQEEVKLVEREGDRAKFRVCFHRDDETEQESNGDEGDEHEGNPFPLEISMPNIAEKVNEKDGGKLDEQKGAQPDFEAAFFHLAAQGFEKV